jgi:hypothetical protein
MNPAMDAALMNSRGGLFFANDSDTTNLCHAPECLGSSLPS